MKKSDLMEMKVKDVIGMKVKYKSAVTKRWNQCTICGIYSNMITILDRKGVSYFRHIEDIERVEK